MQSDGAKINASMSQCLHLEPSGRRCPREAEAGQPFCPAHQAQGTRGFSLAAWRKFVFRVAALVLLFLFALQCYLLLKAALG